MPATVPAIPQLTALAAKNAPPDAGLYTYIYELTMAISISNSLNTEFSVNKV